MISRLEFRHFKCFERLKLPLNALTLLSGGNSSGKSSVIQALALLHQTMRDHQWSSRLMLNGSAIRLGMSGDVIDEISGRDSFEISVYEVDDSSFNWRFQSERHEMSMGVKKTWGNIVNESHWVQDDPDSLHYLLPYDVCDHSLSSRLRELNYLTAERIGPRELYSLEDSDLATVVGPKGENAISLLYAKQDEAVSQQLTNDNAPSNLFRQVESWMSHFFPGCVLEISHVSRSNALNLGIRVSKGSNFYRPIHNGFGLTQVLPIIIASLVTKWDGLLLIENPEVHLHPVAQCAMGQFLALAASSGIQVIIESHSDHILNGIRRTVKDGTLKPDDVALHYFRLRDEPNKAQVESPRIDSHGNIDSWPEGFFDQYDHDMNVFADWT